MINRVLHTLISRCQTPSFKHPGRISASWKDHLKKKLQNLADKFQHNQGELYPLHCLSGKAIVCLCPVSSP